MEGRLLKTNTTESKSLGPTTWEVETPALVFPSDFVKRIGLRSGYYIDLILIAHVETNTPHKIIEEIFPMRIVKGQIRISSDKGKETELRLTENLIEQSMNNEFYRSLVSEINTAYAYDLFRATHVLLRTLFENLIFKLLKTKFQSKSDMYLKKNGLPLDFSRLIENFKNNKEEFVPHGGKVFDEEFFSFLDKFREKANASTHILEAYLSKDQLNQDKNKMNHYIKVINAIIEDVKTFP